MSQIEIQYRYHAKDLPKPELFNKWVYAALADQRRNEDLVIRIVNRNESSQLNKRYRHRDGPTNVLSFRYQVPENFPIKFLGDIVICGPVVEAEAKDQKKDPESHWAHMVIHGVLHLLGFDHTEEQQVLEMEMEEIRILNILGFSDPY